MADHCENLAWSHGPPEIVIFKNKKVHVAQKMDGVP
jgi:hypothetical protein